MSTTVSYKNNTIATINNETRTLTTAGKYMEANLIITDTSSGGNVSQDQDGYIVLPSSSSGGNSDGGNNSNLPTMHTIHLDFTDDTDTDINIYYDNLLIHTMITNYGPASWSYNNKTVTTASLDNVTWYDINAIPIGVELIDYTQAIQDYAIDSNGNVYAEQWYSVSDYTPIIPGQTYSYTGCYWFNIAFYDSTKTLISTLSIYSDSTQDPEDSNTGHGTLTGNKIPSNAAYLRITGGYNAASDNMSLIRLT